MCALPAITHTRVGSAQVWLFPGRGPIDNGTQDCHVTLGTKYAMKIFSQIFAAIHACMAGLFAIAALLLIFIAAKSTWLAVASGLNGEVAQQIIEAIGLLAAAVVALQIAQTIAEEEVARNAHISGPTRVRRFLSRFLVVVVVAISIEALVATFRAAHEEPIQLLYAASILIAAGVLLAAWGIFVRLNVYAEELEPEAMADAKREDKELH